MNYANVLKSAVAAAALVLVTGPLHAAPPAPAPAPVVLSDAEVLGLMATANDAEINAGQVASTKAVKLNVKEFGLKMVTEHSTNNLKIKDVELKSGIARLDSDTSRDLKKNADAMIDSLKKVRSADFDKSYIDSQVMMHQELLTKLDTEIIPHVQNADVKAYLMDTRAAVESHLNEAKQIQAGLAQP